MNAHSEAKLVGLYPEFVRRIRQADDMLSAAGYRFGIAQALRTWTQQDALWEEGRNPEGQIVDPKLVKTHARGGESYHNYGLAIDGFFMDGQGAAIWDEHYLGYQKMVEVCESLGLTCGARWHGDRRDPDHVQMHGPFDEVSPDDEIKYLFREGGFAAVFEAMDKSLGIQGAT